ncbi:hypothetical protein F1880_003795 [Penicillium rolfsii]|nr:hypothetical protein F1880_003795 [Penicillium rolfsii]
MQGSLVKLSTSEATVTTLVGNGTITESLEPTTIVSSSTLTQTETRFETTTLSCILAPAQSKRGLLKPRSTTASPTAINRSTVTKYVTTSTVTVKGAIEHDTDVKAQTKTLEKATTTVVFTSVVTKTFSITVPGKTSYVTSTSTTYRSFATMQPSNESMTSSLNTATETTEVTVYQSPTTTVITQWITVESKSTESDPTSELRKTVTQTRTPSVTTTSQNTLTSTEFVKTVTTTTATVTKTAENAPNCPTRRSEV